MEGDLFVYIDLGSIDNQWGLFSVSPYTISQNTP